MYLVLYVDDFVMSGPEENMEKAWADISAVINIEDPGPMGLYLGCVHEEGAAETDDGRKIRTMTIEPEEPRDSGGANGSGGPAGSTPGPMAAAVHKDQAKPLKGGVKIPSRNTTHVSVRIPTGDGSWGVRYFVKGKTGRKPSIVNFKPLVRVAPEDSDPSQWAPNPPPQRQVTRGKKDYDTLERIGRQMA